MSGLELEFIKDAFESNYVAPLGPMVDAFEKEFAEYVGIKHCLALSSGTAAMHLALGILGVGPGDKVFASTLTFIGSVTPISFLGAVPVFIDADRSTWNMDPDLLAEELEACSENGSLPKAVVPTDLYGQCCDLGQIVEICHGYGVPVICDSAESLGARYTLATDTHGYTWTSKDQINKTDLRPPTSDHWKHAGCGARAAVFSFNGNKIITTSGGGMLVSDDAELIERAKKLSQQARDPAPHYEHSEIGYNYRMSNILAAIGQGQLRVLEERVNRKREIFDYYKKALGDLPGIEFMPEAPYSRSNCWLTVILITPAEFGLDREKVRLALEGENIEARPVWKPMHMQPVFSPQITPVPSPGATGQAQISTDYKGGKRFPCRVVGGEVAEDLFERGLCLPSGTAMAEEDLDRVISVIHKCRRKVAFQ